MPLLSKPDSVILAFHVYYRFQLTGCVIWFVLQLALGPPDIYTNISPSGACAMGPQISMLYIANIKKSNTSCCFAMHSNAKHVAHLGVLASGRFCCCFGLFGIDIPQRTWMIQSAHSVEEEASVASRNSGLSRLQNLLLCGTKCYKT
jgi:hypothetical protein